MPPLIIELHESRTFNVNATGGKAKFLYYVSGNMTEAEAYDLVLSTSPDIWENFVRDEIDMSNRPTLSQWWPVVNYTLPVYAITPNPDVPGEGGSSPPSSSPSHSQPADDSVVDGVSISISLENQKVTTSLKTVDSAAIAPFNCPDYKQLVNVAAGKVEGVEIGIPKARITYKKKLPYLTAKYFRTLLYMCGKTNSDPWWFFKEEEGQFVGVNGQGMGTGGFDINYEFDYIRTRYGLDIRGDGTLICPEKRGHHYLWTANFPEKDAVANVIVERPRAYFVEQMYDSISFDYLGI